MTSCLTVCPEGSLAVAPVLTPVNTAAGGRAASADAQPPPPERRQAGTTTTTSTSVLRAGERLAQ
eukprot:7494653-Alexandrium_andersonii.AAC.1